MLNIDNVPREAKPNRAQGNRLKGRTSRGMIAVSERLLLKLNGSTAQVLRVSPLRMLREFGKAGLKFARVVALRPPMVVTVYMDSNLLECWNCKIGRSVWCLEQNGTIRALSKS
jgi:hypothetical protein